MTIKDKTELLEALSKLHKDRNDYRTMLSTANSGLSKIDEAIKNIESQLLGSYKGRSNYSVDEVASTRRSIIGLLNSGSKAIGELTQALPAIDSYLINRELKTLCDKKAVAWNGKMGVASKYIRVAA